ncbi:MAG: thioesterase [Ignavibacteriaceae bacterium]
MACTEQFYFEEKKTIRANEVDFLNRLKMNFLFAILQDTAAAHANELQLGYEQLIRHNLSWVLSWIKVIVKRLPGFNETITIRTWPKERYKLYSLRDFIICSEKGEEIFIATTAWLPVNTLRKKIVDVKNLPVPIKYYPNQKAIEDLPGKISLDENISCKAVRKVNYNDIDLNQHLNNTKYIEMVTDCYSKQFYEKHKPAEIEAVFNAECFYGDEIEIWFGLKNENIKQDKVAVINRSIEKTVFSALIKWD